MLHDFKCLPRANVCQIVAKNTSCKTNQATFSSLLPLPCKWKDGRGDTSCGPMMLSLAWKKPHTEATDMKFGAKK